MIAEVVYFARVKVPRWLICICALHFGGEILLFVSFSGPEVLVFFDFGVEPQNHRSTCQLVQVPRPSAI